MTTPVVVLLQGHVSLVAILANLLAAPLVAPATLAGALTTLVAPFFPALGAWVAWLGVPPAWLTAQIGRVGATLPGAVIPWPEGPPGALLLAGILVALLLTAPRLAWGVRARPGLTAAVVAGAVATSWPVGRLTWPPPDWRVVVCDVGQGDGVVLATGAGSAVVIDVGPEATPVAGCLRRLGVDTLDAVILTHFDADHVGGLASVLHGWPVAEVFVTPTPLPEGGAALVDRLASEHGIGVRELWAGDRLSWGEVTAQVWWPARTIHSGSVSNNASVVLAVHSGAPPIPGERDVRLRVLLLGDIEREAGAAILSALRREADWQGFAADLDLVKTPHHGSSNLDESLMRAVPATIAAVSVGENDFGHPTPSHLELFRSLGSTVLRTDEHGDIALLEPRDDGALRWRVLHPP